MNVRYRVELSQAVLGAGSDPFVGTSGGNALLQSLFQFLNELLQRFSHW